MGVSTVKGQELMAQKVSFGSVLHLTAGQVDSQDKLEKIVLTVTVPSPACTKVCTVHKGVCCTERDVLQEGFVEVLFILRVYINRTVML